MDLYVGPAEPDIRIIQGEMTMSKLLSFFLTVLTAFYTMFAPVLIVKAPADDTDFKPVFRFIASSDSHVQAGFDTNSRRVQKMIRLGYAIAGADEDYDGLDAVLIAGDMTDNGRKDQFCALRAAVSSVLREGTEFLGITAKNHDGYNMSRKELHDYCGALFGGTADFHTVIGGFHFIGLSASENDDVHYDDGQVAWLREQLEAATAEDPLRPVFVMHHEHVANTVYGSSDFEGWGMSYFTDVLDDFPQVVDFSGHSHYPLNDPRSVWQGSFTAVGTGALYYTELTVDDVRTIHPDGYKKVATFWMVELDAANRIRLRGIDLGAQKVLCEYILDNPADPANRGYSPDKRAAASEPPVFDEGAAVKVKNRISGCKVTVPAARPADGMPVVLYRAAVYGADGVEVGSEWTIPRYYEAKEESDITVTLPKLPKGEYEVRVVAETAYGVRSAPLTAGFAVK